MMALINACDPMDVLESSSTITGESVSYLVEE